MNNNEIMQMVDLYGNLSYNIMEHRACSDKNILRITNFVFPEVPNQRNSSVVVRKDKRCSFTMKNARSVTCSKLNMKIIGKKVESFSEFSQMPVRTQTLNCEESFFSWDSEHSPGVSAGGSQYPRLEALKTMKNFSLASSVSVNLELTKNPLMVNQFSVGKSKFAMVKKYFKVEKNPMKDWIVEETFTSSKPIHLVKPKNNVVSKQRVVRNFENNKKTRKVTAWVPRAIPFLNVVDDHKKIVDD